MRVVIRAKQTPPLKCYGLEHAAADPVCKACPHASACAKAGKSREGKVKLSQTHYTLTCGSRLEARDPDQDFDALYASCYTIVFKKTADNWKHRIPDAATRVAANAAEAKCSIRLFVTTVMAAFNDASPDRRFFCNMLVGPASVRTVVAYRKVAAARYGVFDFSTLGELSGTVENLPECLSISEELAGRWIIGHRLRNEGSPFDSLFSSRELGLDPRWLATEPVYFSWVARQPRPSDEIAAHRKRVAMLDGEAYTRARSAIMPAAVDKVLQRFAVNSNDFMCDATVSNGLLLWAKLGSALKHLVCLRMLNGEESRFVETRPTLADSV